jgi:hypothetical protein
MNLGKVSGQNPMVFVYKDNVRKTESGNIFIAIFGAIALIGILGASVMTFMKGPLSTSVKLTKINTAENQMAIGSQVAVMATANQPNNGDCELIDPDGAGPLPPAPDGFVEPLEWRTATTEPIPTGGGLVPLSLGISKKDPWGTEYGYCVWNHGPSVSGNGCGANMLAGTNDRIYPVVSIISAGPDKAFTTTCRSFADADVVVNGNLLDAGDLPMISKAAETDDDIITSFTYEEATGVSGGLWSIKAGDPGTAVIGKNIETTGVANLGGGLLLPDKAFVDCTLPSNAGVMAKNGNAIEICDGAGAWTAITGGSVGGSGLILNPNVSTAMNIDGTCGTSTCYSTNVVFTLTNNLTPAAASDVLSVTLSNTLNFEKVSDNCNGNSIAAGATCQIVVRARASGNISYAGTLNITGNNSPLAMLDGVSSNFPGCNIGGNAPGGFFIACGIAGYDLVVTPSGCAAGTINPVCSGAADSLTLAVSPATPTALSGYTTNANGQQTTADLMGYSGGTMTFPAVNHCASLVYSGFDDWFLPSASEIASYLYPNRASINMGTGRYRSSTLCSLPAGTGNRFTTVLGSTGAAGGCSSSDEGADPYLVRCFRWSPNKPVTPVVDTTPISVSFTDSYGAPSVTRTSNTITVVGITQPISISVSGGTSSQYSINGGPYTSTAGTVSNADQVTLQTTSPPSGQESVITLTLGSSSFNWLVRSPGNNILRIFTTRDDTTAAFGGVSGGDNLCTTAANTAGLSGSFVAVLVVGNGTSVRNRLPWNWTQMRNMQGQLVATGLNDFMDGSVLAAMNFTEYGLPAPGSIVWTGMTGGGSGDSWFGGDWCSNWTGTWANAASGDSALTSGGQYFGNGGRSCNSGSRQRLLCISTNGGSGDLDPNTVNIQPQVAFSPGATGTSNTVTVGGVTDAVTVSITPAAGTANIIKGGVSLGATTTTAGLNETLAFTLTAPMTMGQRNMATIMIGPDSYTWWVGYADSAREAKIFVTSTSYGNGQTWPGIGNLNSVCTSVAASSPYGLSGTWKWLGSTTTSDAAYVIPWNWGTLRNLQGDIIVDGGLQDLFDGTIDMPIRYDQNGNNVTANVATVSTAQGLRSTTIVDQGGALTTCNDLNGSPYYGQSITVGNPQNADNRWISSGGAYCPSDYRLYCIEDIDTTVPDTTPNQINLDYIVQVPVSSRQTSPAVTIGGLSSGATGTLSVSASSGTPRIKVNGGPEVASASVSNGDSVVFLMDAPATANSSNTMTITAGTMTTTWRVWSGWDGIGTGVKRVFVTSTDPNGAAFGGVTGGDTHCQSRAAAAGLGGTWRAILSSTAEATWAVNRVGYNWAELRLVDGTTTVAYAPNLWSTLLNPIIQTEFGATRPSTRILSGTASNGKTYSTTADLSNMFNWTNASCSATYMQGNSSSLSATITQGYWLCQSDGALYCIEQ